MEEKESVAFPEKVKDFLGHNLLFIGIVSFGLILLIIGIFQYFALKPTDEVEFIQQTKGISASNAEDAATLSSKTISIDVEGQVQKPGIYTLPEGSRVQDALIAAGGMSSKADREYVSKHINLAQKLIDGGKVYIVRVGEMVPAETALVQQSSSNTGISQTIGDNSSLININSATLEQLDTLPKVGPVTAQKIVSNRPYQSKDELVGKKVMTQKTYEGLKDKIVAE